MELAIVLVIALVIFGPKRLPELGRSMGRGFREFKSSVTGDDKDDVEAKHAEIEESSMVDESAKPGESAASTGSGGAVASTGAAGAEPAEPPDTAETAEPVEGEVVAERRST